MAQNISGGVQKKERENLFSQNHVFHFVRVGGSISSFVHTHINASQSQKTNGDQYKTLPDTREEKKVYKYRKRGESFNVRYYCCN